MVLRNHDEQLEFVRLIGERMEHVKESIPQIGTADEAKSFAISSAIVWARILHTFGP